MTSMLVAYGPKVAFYDPIKEVESVWCGQEFDLCVEYPLSCNVHRQRVF